jgi:hypothetical protein
MIAVAFLVGLTLVIWKPDPIEAMAEKENIVGSIN